MCWMYLFAVEEHNGGVGLEARFPQIFTGLGDADATRHNVLDDQHGLACDE